MKTWGSLVVLALIFGYVSLAISEEMPAGTAASSDSASETANGTAASDSDAVEGVEAVETVEIVETVETVETVDVVPVATDMASSEDETRTETAKQQSLIVTAGRLHPAFVHLPMGLLIALLLFEIFSLYGATSGRFGAALWIVAIGAFVPAIISGMLRAKELMDMGGQLEADVHRNLMIAAFAILCAAAGIRGGMRKKNRGAIQWIFIGLIALGTLLAFIGAHHGGKLVYGENFLPF